MTAPERLSDTAPWRDWFEQAMNQPGATLDNASDRLWGPNGQYDGPRCIGEDCGSPVDGEGGRCEDCAVCPTCRGAGGWQQYDGLIVECPRGCMTDGSAA